MKVTVPLKFLDFFRFFEPNSKKRLFSVQTEEFIFKRLNLNLNGPIRS
jgi:hypothetical protein